MMINIRLLSDAKLISMALFRFGPWPWGSEVILYQEQGYMGGQMEAGWKEDIVAILEYILCLPIDGQS
jgi:hypothetical protein